MNTRKNWMNWLTILLLTFSVGIFAACEADTEEAGEMEDQMEDMDEGEGLTEEGPMLDAISDNPEMYMGQTVTVTGEVNDMWGDTGNAFTIGGEGLDLGEEILVVGAAGMSPMGGALNDDAIVEVTGTVRQYVQLDFQNEFGLDFNTMDGFEYEESGPAIVATSVNILAADDDEADD